MVDLCTHQCAVYECTRPPPSASVEESMSALDLQLARTLGWRSEEIPVVAKEVGHEGRVYRAWTHGSWDGGQPAEGWARGRRLQSNPRQRASVGGTGGIGCRPGGRCLPRRR